jgi:hypothetical protein
MPKASTFYAGQETLVGRHVFVWIQASVKRPGEFTVNIVLSDTHNTPDPSIPLNRSAFNEREVGFYRLGELVGGKDKWWSIAPEKGFAWLWQVISASQKNKGAISNAIAVVTADVKVALSDLGLLNNALHLASGAVKFEGRRS